MAQLVCPWWIGMLMASPVRSWFDDPEKLLRPYIREGMTVLEPGPGMGFFTLPMAKMVGVSGRVIAVDVQQKMLNGLRHRADGTRANLTLLVIRAVYANDELLPIGDHPLDDSLTHKYARDHY